MQVWKITCGEYKDTAFFVFLFFVFYISDSNAALNIAEVYDSCKIQVKAGRARGNNTGQRRMGIYFSLKIQGIAE